MPYISRRAREAYRSPIRELEDEAAAAKTRGTHVLHLNIGQPDLATPPAAWEALRDFADGDVLAYGPARGLASYRAALVRYYASWGVELDVEDVNVTTGASEALWLAVNGIADPGDAVVVPEPFYALYNGFLQLAEISVQPVLTTLDGEFALPEPEAIEAAVTGQTRAILLCNPSNPTGQVYTAEALAAIGAIAERHDLYVVVDEVYREFVYDEVRFTSALAIPSLRRRAVVIDSVSKRYSACGARIGSIACRDRDLMMAITRLSRFRLCPPTIGQHLCERILSVEDDYLARALTEYARRREVLYEGLSAIEGVRCYRPRGAFYCFAELPVEDTDAFARWLLTDFSHDGATVMLAPGAGFYATPGRGKREVRIAYVLNVEDLGRALACLRAGLLEWVNTKRQAEAGEALPHC